MEQEELVQQAVLRALRSQGAPPPAEGTSHSSTPNVIVVVLKEGEGILPSTSPSRQLPPVQSPVDRHNSGDTGIEGRTTEPHPLTDPVEDRHSALLPPSSTALPLSALPSKNNRRPGKLIQDRVHEHVLLPMLAIDIIDTEEFQRLRYLKQLGTTVFLYPGATHTRFEHSIGVAHLAGETVKYLKLRQPELQITEKDELCVIVAGLCHDLGHGPFSHLFETVINRIRKEEEEDKYIHLIHPSGSGSNPNAAHFNQEYCVSNTPHANRTKYFYKSSQGSTANGSNHHHNNNNYATSKHKEEWHHEQMSLQLLRNIFQKVDYESYGLDERDIRFIELCITGLPPGKPWPGIAVTGREEPKRFLVDIVANKRHGIDVDKLDYFLRDSLGVYGRTEVNVHFPRLLSACKVLDFEGESQICYEEKLALNLGDIFAVRAKLHKYAYQHRIVKVTDYMVSDALRLANPHFKIKSPTTGRLLRVSDCVDDNEAFIKLGDWILNGIAASEKVELLPAQRIIDRLTRRDLYRIAGSATLNTGNTLNHLIREDQVRMDIIEFLCSQDVHVLEVLELLEDAQGEEEENTEEEEEEGVPPPPAVTTAGLPLSHSASSSTPVPVTPADRQRVRQALTDTIIVSFTTINYGSSDLQGRPDDPINKVTFYNPKMLSKGAFRLPYNRVSPLFSPSAFCEVSILVLVRERRFLEKVSTSFDSWKEHNQRFLSIAVPNTNNSFNSSSHHNSNTNTNTNNNNNNSNTSHPPPSHSYHKNDTRSPSQWEERRVLSSGRNNTTWNKSRSRARCSNNNTNNNNNNNTVYLHSTAPPQGPPSAKPLSPVTLRGEREEESLYPRGGGYDTLEPPLIRTPVKRPRTQDSIPLDDRVVESVFAQETEVVEEGFRHGRPQLFYFDSRGVPVPVTLSRSGGGENAVPTTASGIGVEETTTEATVRHPVSPSGLQMWRT